MPTDQERILDAVIEVRESIRTGSYSSTGWHSAYEKLNQLVGVVCEVVNGDAEYRDPAKMVTGDELVAVAGELQPCDAEPTLDAVLEAARRHCYSVTFRFSGDD